MNAGFTPFKLLLLGIFLLSAPAWAQSQFGFNNETPDSSAVIDVVDTARGVLLPRVTTTQRNNINNPAMGLLVFDTDKAAFYFYNGAVWLPMPSNGVLQDGDSLVLKDGSGEDRMIMNPNTGTFKMLDNDTVWYSMQVNSPPQSNTILNGSFTQSVDQDGQLTLKDANGVTRYFRNANGDHSFFNASGNKIGQTFADTTGDAGQFVFTSLDPSGMDTAELKMLLDAFKFINSKVDLTIDSNGITYGRNHGFVFQTIELTTHDSGGGEIKSRNNLTGDSAVLTFDNFERKIKTPDKFAVENTTELKGDLFLGADSAATISRPKNTFADGNNTTLKGQDAANGGNSGGDITITPGIGSGGAPNGDINLNGDTKIDGDLEQKGNVLFGTDTSEATISRPRHLNSTGLPLNITGQKAGPFSNANGGDIVLTPGVGDGTGVSGSILMSGNIFSLDFLDSLFFQGGKIFLATASGEFKLIADTAAITANKTVVSNDLNVMGTLTKSSGTFRIDHPLDPYNKYLFHSFVESPDMMNIYNGNVTTGKDGKAEVQMPDYFNALNTDFRYQLTVIGSFSRAMVLGKMKDNKFIIQTEDPHVEVSWQVTGVRQDTYANEHRVEVEVDKEASMKGKLLYEPSKASK